VRRIRGKRKGDSASTARTEEFASLDDASVTIRPTKVVRSALETAVTAASLLIITEAAVAEKPQEARSHARDASCWWHGWMGGMDDFGGDDFWY
jgi:chaperonin GroEL